eukprot:Sdes_comp20854_c0_seq13m17666
MEKRTFEEECEYLEKINDYEYRIKVGFVPNMKVPLGNFERCLCENVYASVFFPSRFVGVFFVNPCLSELVFDELKQNVDSETSGGFIPAVKQIANVASLPGIVGSSIALPDVHAGYGFAIGNVAAFDVSEPDAIVSPGGVGFDINCGVRLIRTNLMENDILPIKEELAQSLFDHIPVGVGTKGNISLSMKQLEEALELGMDWSLREGESGYLCPIFTLF